LKEKLKVIPGETDGLSFKCLHAEKRRTAGGNQEAISQGKFQETSLKKSSFYAHRTGRKGVSDTTLEANLVFFMPRGVSAGKGKA